MPGAQRGHVAVDSRHGPGRGATRRLRRGGRVRRPAGHVRRTLGDGGERRPRADRVGDRAARPCRGVGTELARVDRRRARRDDGRRRPRPRQHPVQGRGGGLRARTEQRAPCSPCAASSTPTTRRSSRARVSRSPRSRTRFSFPGKPTTGWSHGRNSLRERAPCPMASSMQRVASIGPDDPSDVVFTSGTTGSPKGVVMTHGQTLRAYLDWCDWADLRPGDRYLIVNPFFHIFGYKAGCLASLMRGATIFPSPCSTPPSCSSSSSASGSPSCPGHRRSINRCSTIPTRRRRHLEPAARGDRRRRHPGRAHPARAKSCRSSGS